TLDEEATASTPNLSSRLRVDDLRATGWTVVGPTRAGARTVLRATKGFRTPAEAGKVLDEGSGPDGPVGGFTLKRERRPLWWAWTFEGDLDLRGGIERFGDAELRSHLEGTSFGLDAAQAQDLFGLQVALRLPGRVERKGAEMVDGRAVWTGRFGESMPLMASSRDLAVPREVAGGVAVLALAGLVVLWFRLSRTRRASG
ncbi:MAG: hypothetical protein HYR89_00555, partial [Actinobacteria bacterium]|nr:hypothetical protein [Actinomycetota bacterium]